MTNIGQKPSNSHVENSQASNSVQMGPVAPFFSGADIAKIQAALIEPFSQAELRVVEAIAQGYLKTDQLSQELSLKEKTIGAHLSNLSPKVPVHSRNELRNFLKNLGIKILPPVIAQKSHSEAREDIIASLSTMEKRIVIQMGRGAENLGAIVKALHGEGSKVNAGIVDQCIGFICKKTKLESFQELLAWAKQNLVQIEFSLGSVPAAPVPTAAQMGSAARPGSQARQVRGPAFTPGGSSPVN